MHMNRIGLPLLAIALLLLPSCASLRSKVEPKVDLRSYRHIFVEHLLADGNGTDQVIARELRAMGYDASSGPLTMMPENAQLIVSYADVWTFDLSNYMLELEVRVRRVGEDHLIATADYRRPSLTGGSTLDMVDHVLGRLFGPQKPH
jgi:hypothetical protein